MRTDGVTPLRGTGRTPVRGLVLAALLSSLAWAAATPARADNDARRRRLYVTELAVVLEGSRRLLLWAETYAGDAELARFAYPLTEQYVAMSGRMTPPDKLSLVHPHVLIVVENVERALDAALRGDLPAFRQHVRIVREELVTLEGVLKHLKVRLPELAR